MRIVRRSISRNQHGGGDGAHASDESSGSKDKAWLKNVDKSPLPAIPPPKGALKQTTGPTGTDITFGQQHSTHSKVRIQTNQLPSPEHKPAPSKGVASAASKDSAGGSSGVGGGGMIFAAPLRDFDNPAVDDRATDSESNPEDHIKQTVNDIIQNIDFDEDAPLASTKSPHPKPPSNAINIPQGGLVAGQILKTDPVPFRLRCMADPERIHRIRTTTFLGRSRKQLRPEDLLLETADVSKIHCSITTVGNPIVGYKLKLVWAQGAKAPVSINGAKLKHRGRPYKLKVGDIILVGLREMWRVERATLDAPPVKHILDELQIYGEHKEFLQLALGDVETVKNVSRCPSWIELVSLIVELVESAQEIEKGDQWKSTEGTTTAMQTTMQTVVSGTGTGTVPGSGPQTLTTLTNSSSSGNPNLSHQNQTNTTLTSNQKGGGGPGGANFASYSSNMYTSTSSSSGNMQGGPHTGTGAFKGGITNNTVSSIGAPPNHSFDGDSWIPHQTKEHEDMSTVLHDDDDFFFGNFENKNNNDTFYGDHDFMDESLMMRDHPRCADLIEILDEVGHVIHSFGPLSSYEEMVEFGIAEIKETLVPGRFVRLHLCFFPPLVAACKEHIEGGILRCQKKLVGGGDPKSQDRIAIM